MPKYLESLRAPALLAVLACTLSAYGQQAYRCGNTYSQSPCAGGTAIDITDSRTPEQKAETDAAAVRSQALADRLQKDRLAREKHAAPATSRHAVAPHPHKPTGKPKPAPSAGKPNTKATPKTPSTGSDFVATVKTKKNAEKKAEKKGVKGEKKATAKTATPEKSKTAG